MKKLIIVWKLLLALILLPSCANQPYIESRMDYAVIPEGLLVLPEMPPTASDPLSIQASLSIGAELRIYGCILHMRLAEIIRYSTRGEKIIDQLSDRQCPDLAN